MNKAKLIASAQRYAQKGKYRRAIGEYQKLLRGDPEDLRARLKLADLYSKMGSVREATHLFASVAEHYARQGFALKAVAVYKQILKIDVTAVDVHLALAQTYQELGLVNDAANAFRQAVLLLEQQGDVARRLEVIRDMLELDPDNVAVRIRLAEDYSRHGLIEEAAEQLRAACDLLRRSPHRDDFQRVAERLLHHSPDDFDVGRELAALYIEQDFPQRALPKLQRCFRLRPRDPEVLELLARAFELLHQQHKTLVVLKALAKVYEESGLTVEHEETLLRVLELDPEDEAVRRVLNGGKAEPISVAAEIVFEEVQDTEDRSPPTPLMPASPQKVAVSEAPVEATAPPPPPPPEQPPAQSTQLDDADLDLPFTLDEEPLDPRAPFLDDDVTIVDRRIILPERFPFETDVIVPERPARIRSSAERPQPPRPTMRLAQVTDDDEADGFVASNGDGVPAAARHDEDISGDVQELDFFLEHGHVAEAQAILDELLVRCPEHPDVVVRALRLQRQRS